MRDLMTKNKFLPEYFQNQLMIGLIARLKADGFDFKHPDIDVLTDRNAQILERHLYNAFMTFPSMERKFYAGLRKLSRTVGIISKKCSMEVIRQIEKILSDGAIPVMEAALEQKIELK